jgi:hypothetical protein
MGKVGSRHLERKACVYVRQSSLAQVQHHRESGERQYKLQERAVALGWRTELVNMLGYLEDVVFGGRNKESLPSLVRNRL